MAETASLVTLPSVAISLWMLPFLCLVGVKISYLLLAGMSVKKKKRPRLPRLALELGLFGAIIGWLTAWVMLHPWTEAHLTRLVPVRLFAFPFIIIGVGPGLVAKWILCRSMVWRLSATEVAHRAARDRHEAAARR